MLSSDIQLISNFLNTSTDLLAQLADHLSINVLYSYFFEIYTRPLFSSHWSSYHLVDLSVSSQLLPYHVHYLSPYSNTYCTFMADFSSYSLITNDKQQWIEWATLSYSFSDTTCFWQCLTNHHKSLLVNVQLLNQIPVSPVYSNICQNCH